MDYTFWLGERGEKLPNATWWAAIGDPTYWPSPGNWMELADACGYTVTRFSDADERLLEMSPLYPGVGLPK